jgi:endonuclease YncB( thermonuclease family)
MIGIGKLVVAFVLAAGGVGTSVAVVNAAGTTDRDQGVVERVVDGDTVDVSVNGTTTRIRLLNIDTPESVDPNQPVQCLGPEATEFLKTVLPVGTTVGLEYDEERIDRYDRTLAAVFTSDGMLVNAEIARQGLAATMVIGDNDRFYPQVEQARAEAMAAGRGLYSTDVACTVPAQVGAATAAADGAAPINAQATSTDLDTSVAVAAATTASTVGLQQSLADSRLGVAWAALPPGEQERVASMVDAAREKAQQNEVAARTAASAAREREAAAARAEDERRQSEARERAVQQEREQQAARERAARTAEAARQERERRAAAQAAQRQKQAAESPKQAENKPDNSSGGPAGYTGPRCYAPGGKTWRPC